MVKFSFKKMIASLCFVPCLVLTPTSAHAVIASVKTFGMAATGIAYPQDAQAAVFNPAGMADVGDRYDLGFEVARTSRQATVRGNLSPLPSVNGKFDANHKAKYAYNGDFGINKMLGNNMSLGLVVYNRNFSKTKYKHALPLFGTSKVGMEYAHETISPTFSIKLLEKHNFGVSLNYMIQRLWVQGLQNFAKEAFGVGIFSKFPRYVTNHKYSYSQGVGFTFGYRCQVADRLSVGVTYQPKTYMSKFKKYKGFLAGKGRLNIPQKIGAGFAWRLLPYATLAFDVEYINWRKVKALHRPLQDNLTAHKLGAHNGTGFGFRDQWFYRLGIDYELTEWLTVRAGYRHTRAPIKRSQTAVNVLTVDTIEDYLTLGATACLNSSNEISIFYGHGFSHKIKGKNSIPPSFGLGEANIKQSDDVFGVSWGHTY
ncbi:hypothetical protein DB42_CK00110 [Neochlamydia sp. EPS4]|uniref:OmpP1/FadL family transporter n=1 Tax=Neochlamydia sp. EPS4 TaxID=1478175 RepID=UPI0005838EBE|nr:outer membrane protein transport protein [Neochlamydia sp. EPS4]KIC73042.1 hypothetical protein DB42_CK00110 [Neochlamydia sp. EPS4]